MLPHDLSRWEVVYQQTQRGLRAGCREAMAYELRLLLRLRPAAGRSGQPSAVILDARAVPSTPESIADAGYDGHKYRKGRRVHQAVDTLGHLLATIITPANEQARAQVIELAALVQQVTGQTVELAFVDQGSTGDEPGGRCGAGRSVRDRQALPHADGPSARPSCRHAARSLSAASPGRRASAAWRAATNACPKPYQG
jgi:hypothetical protein